MDRVPLPKICHTYPEVMKLGTVIPYLKKIQKTYKLCNTPFEFCLHQHFFYQKSAVIVISRNFNIGYISIIKTLIFWTFFEPLKVFLINMVHVSKIGYSMPSWNKNIFKQKLWRYNLCSWRHQENFITWLKLNSRCGHVTKVW